MTEQERAEIIQLLNESHREFLNLIERLTPEQWAWKPAPGRWSAGEIAEHIVLSEGLLLARVEAALSAPPNPDWETKTARKTDFLMKVMAPRLGRALAPERLQPQATPAQAGIVRRFAELRAITLQFAERTTASLHDHTAEHPMPVFNTLSAHQWLLYIPLHNMRHHRQIQEVIQTPGFPEPAVR